MSVVDVLLCALGGLAVGSGVLVVTTRHVVRAGLWLVVTLGALAGCYLVLNAEFVAWVQMLVYVGAVVVLLLFATMLTRAPVGASSDVDRHRLPAALVGLGATATLVTLLVDAFADAKVDLDDDAVGTAGGIGQAVFGDWVLAFELVSVLLLAALVGAIVLSGRGRDADAPAGSEGER